MAFTGWPPRAIEFFTELAANNHRDWWQAHKDEYERDVRAPMAELLAELEPEFGPARLFRPYRDVRFRADKSPYKTTIAASFQAGGYVQLSAQGLGAGTGMFHLAPDQLDRYRRAVADDATGGQLQAVLDRILRDEGAGIGGHERLRTAPRGYPRDHPRIDLLRYKGLIVWKQWPVEDWLSTPGARERVTGFLRLTGPFNEWLAAHVGPSLAEPSA